MKYEELTEKIIYCAFNVYNQMGPGYLESVYTRCLQIELQSIDLITLAHHPIRVFYKNVSVGNFIADLIIEDLIIVELKAISKITKLHEAQLVNYLVATGKDVGLLINFGPDKVVIKRKLRLLEA